MRARLLKLLLAVVAVHAGSSMAQAQTGYSCTTLDCPNNSGCMGAYKDTTACVIKCYVDDPKNPGAIIGSGSANCGS